MLLHSVRAGGEQRGLYLHGWAGELGSVWSMRAGCQMHLSRFSSWYLSPTEEHGHPSDSTRSPELFSPPFLTVITLLLLLRVNKGTVLL